MGSDEDGGRCGWAEPGRGPRGQAWADRFARDACSVSNDLPQVAVGQAASQRQATPNTPLRGDRPGRWSKAPGRAAWETAAAGAGWPGG
jgi:hypothetical protein